MIEAPTAADRYRGVLLGTAVGDALGLPTEGISPRRIAKLRSGEWRHRFVLGRGMVSDDTEHTIFVAQALLAHPDSADAFARRLAWSLRGWVLALPAGIGWGTLRAIGKLWLGVPPSRSGVWSAGNGPAMRVAPLGAFFAQRPAELEEWVRASTTLTHRDPRALVGTRAVAQLVAWTVREELVERPSVERFLEELRSAGPEDDEWLGAVDHLAACARSGTSGASVADLAARLGLSSGVSGYVHHTVPVAAYAWFHHFGDYRATLAAVLDCGGDTDTTGAIVGAMAGALVGERGIPVEWIEGVVDWPRGRALLGQLSERLAAASAGERTEPVRYPWPAVLPRNLLFLTLVLLHGFRRLLPPY